MRGKTIVITGATSGIGEVAAIRLAEMGARIVFTARDKIRADVTMEKLRRVNGAVEHAVHMGDLSLLADMKRVAGEIGQEPRIDVLINNAGALFNARQGTSDGLEKTFALNHLSYFAITNLLLRRLNAGARIVSTSSGAHRRAKLDFDDLQSRHGYGGFAVYSKSKLCNILFTRELARRLSGTGITANCLHPGFVATRFGDNNGGIFRVALGIGKRFFALTPEEGAETIVYLASSPDVAGTSGSYFARSRPAMPTAAAQDDMVARSLWEESARLAKF